jgi:hypothetical protein
MGIGKQLACTIFDVVETGGPHTRSTPKVDGPALMPKKLSIVIQFTI